MVPIWMLSAVTTWAVSPPVSPSAGPQTSSRSPNEPAPLPAWSPSPVVPPPAVVSASSSPRVQPAATTATTTSTISKRRVRTPLAM